MSQILVVPSSEKVANIELSSVAQILYREGGRGVERGEIIDKVKKFGSSLSHLLMELLCSLM